MEMEKLWLPDTYTKIPNNILRLFIDDKNPTDQGIIAFVARWSCGFGRRDTHMRISLERFAKELGRHKSQVSKRIRALIASGMLFRGNKRGNDYVYSLIDVFSGAKSVACQEKDVACREKDVYREEKGDSHSISSGETQSMVNNLNPGLVNLSNPVNKVFKEREEINTIKYKKYFDITECQHMVAEFVDVQIGLGIKDNVLKALCWCKQSLCVCSGKDDCRSDLKELLTDIGKDTTMPTDCRRLSGYVQNAAKKYVVERANAMKVRRELLTERRRL